MKCQRWPDDRCRSPMACNGFGYCHERNWDFNGDPVVKEAFQAEWRKMDHDGRAPGDSYEDAHPANLEALAAARANIAASFAPTGNTAANASAYTNTTYPIDTRVLLERMRRTKERAASIFAPSERLLRKDVPPWPSRVQDGAVDDGPHRWRFKNGKLVVYIRYREGRGKGEGRPWEALWLARKQ